MAEPATHRTAWRRWIGRLGLAVLAMMALGAAFLAWAFLPRSLGEVRVEEARLYPSPTAHETRKPSFHVKPVRIAVTFVASQDIESARERLGLGYVVASLAACDHADAHTYEVVSQDADHLQDNGRVRRLGDVEGGVRYRAEFDEALTEMIDFEPAYSSALAAPGGLCFSLDGAGQPFGRGRSNVVRVEVQPEE